MSKYHMDKHNAHCWLQRNKLSDELQNIKKATYTLPTHTHGNKHASTLSRKTLNLSKF